MERIIDIAEVKPGDFVSFKSTLSVVVSVEIKEQGCILTLGNGQVIENKLDERMEFFRTKEKLHIG